MHDQTHGPIELLRFGEGPMATLVCQNPDTGEDETLYCRIRNPCEESKVRVGEERDVCGRKIDQGGGVAEVSDNVCH